ncbi:methyltransferase domain-containing protein [Streptacidiphilus sp. P02-A3a]|uniref:methyltransferase domain-containing protein n=1 Tax=Streptacidiphilus sp. P02-A3a TaxID=2704468 RepID=UPI0015FA0E47|nr:methyltransferase domain-containing protein [Streptacidiphilus sp. P02-A3a]QMU69096.1 methyltransferase domain-containing protein [Streptacidiphilus sp. P02-A3a]
MSTFSDVDRSPRPQELVRYLSEARRGLSAPRARLRELLSPRPGERVLDLGCGAGHELAQLAEDGIVAVGVDASSVMLHASRARLSDQDLEPRLAQADGARLPFRDGVFDACRIERVLQHVADPAAVLAEARRTLRDGGRIAVSEPDWASFTIASADPVTAAAVSARVGAAIVQRDIGRQLRRLLCEAGFTGLRIEVELAVYDSLTELDLVFSLSRATERACEQGAVSAERAADWLAEQRELSATGGFHATLNRSVMAWARR